MRRPALAPASRYALLSLGEVTVDRTAFDRRGARAGGAISTAVAVHAIVLLLASGLGWLHPAAAVTPQPVASSIERFVFTSQAGDGAGRAGGGNGSLTPAALLRTRGDDVRAVPAASPHAVSAPDTIAPERESVPALPVTPMDAGALPQVGALDGVPGPPTDARGPGETGVGTRTGPGRGLGEQPGDGIGEGPYGVGNGVTGPELLHRTPPQYSAEAMRAKVQGVAVLSGIVGVDGVLHDIRVVRSLDAAFGLDREAIACVRQWRFRPGTRQGKPVAVYVTIEVAFNLR
jgi:periplasmic protein TonB